MGKTKTRLIAVLMLLAAFSVVSCQKLDRPEEVPDSAWFATADQIEKPEEGERRITVYTTCDWTVVSSAEWVTVHPASGSAGIHELTLSYSANDSAERRIATIDCKAGNYTDTYTITQEPKE